MEYGLRNTKIAFTLFFLISSFFPFSQISFAAPAAPLPGPAFDASQVGVAAAVRGVVKVAKSSAVGRDVKSGEAIYLGDNISTDEGSNLQILLLDQTVFTIGPNSTIVIDKFVYDPDTNDGAMNAKVVKGVFRFVTGKIGHKDPKKVNIDLPSGTIGIRGTMVAGKVDGKHSLVILLGPGEQNNTSSRRGAIIVSDKGSSEFVGRAGFGTELDGQNPPKEPFQVPADMIKSIDTRIGEVGGEEKSENQNQNQNQNQKQDNRNQGPQGPNPNAPKNEPRGEDSATRQAGQDKAVAGGDVKTVLSDTRIFTKLDHESDRASQRTGQDDFKGGGGGIEGATRYEQLSKFTSGTIKFAQTSVPIFNTDTQTQDGSYNIKFEIDLGSRKMGTGDSSLSGTFHGVSFNFQLDEQTLGSGDAAVVYSNSVDDTHPGVPTFLSVDTVIIPQNADGGIAQNILHAASFVYDTGTSEHEGSGGGIAGRDSSGGDSGIGKRV